MTCRAFDSVPTVSERDLIEIRLEYLLLAVVFLHLARRCLLSQLSAEAQVGAIDQSGMHVANELLRDRARAATLSKNVVLQRAGDADDIDPVVLVEAVVLHGNERLWQILRQRFDRHTGADLLSDLADERSVACQDE